PNVAAVQIIFNMFRQRPAELFFKEARKKNVGLIVRVPLASGLLSGKYDRSTTFAKDDHRTFNRHGEAFDQGETFSGVDYETGLLAVDELKACCAPDGNLAPAALKWILMFPEVSCVIPGASRPEQIERNAAVSNAPALSRESMQAVHEVYDRRLRAQVHQRW
ncbi:MAG TPA: aldo/keto reductase, partial [Spirochaetia bacterium]|nr:aldo/keto reductase [Spirochaetia bacterium]